MKQTKLALSLGIFLCVVSVVYAQQTPAQIQFFKEAQQHLEDADKLMPLIEEARGKLKEKGHAAFTREELEDVAEKRDNIIWYLQQIPPLVEKSNADRSDVVRMVKKYNSINKEMDPAQEEFQIALEAKGSQAATSAGPQTNSYPDLAADIAQVNDMATLLGDTQMFNTDIEKAARVCAQLNDMAQFAKDMKSKYPDILAAGGGGQLGNRLGFYEQQLAGFQRAMTEFQQWAPGYIESTLQMGMDLAKESVQYKRAGAFMENGAVQSRVDDSAQRLKVLEAIDTRFVGYRTSKQRVEEAQATVTQMKDSLRESIISSNRKPDDVYQEQDRNAILKNVKNEWIRQHPMDDIVDICIPFRQWERTREWRLIGNTWYLYNSSRLKTIVGVKTDEKHITKYVVDIFLNHTENNKVTYAVEDKTRTPINSVMLASNWN